MRSVKMLCALMALMLALPGGIAMAEQPQVAMGRYVEVPLDISGEACGAFAQANGTIYAVDGSGDHLLKSLDLNKDNWDTLETGHDEQTSPAQGGVNGIAVGEDGTLYLSSGWAMVDGEGHHFVERIEEGKAERVQLDRFLSGNTDRLTLCALPSGELLGLSDMEAYRFSADGATRQKYAVSGGESMAVHGNEVAICSTPNSLITILDIESGQVLRMLPLPGSTSYGLINYDKEGALYYVCPEGIYRVNAGGTLFEQIADGRLITVGKPSVMAWSLLFDSENNPIIAYSQGGALSLIAYRYDENVATEPGTMLSVFTLYDSRTLRECANQFQLKYPDAMVDITVALPEGTAVTLDDAIRTLNTEVLAGKGPDVLVLDGLPVQSYLDKGVLQDLWPVVQPMIDSGELQDSLAGVFRKDGMIPAVPTRFLLPSIWGDVEGLNTLTDIAAWAQVHPDSMPYYALDVESLIGTFYPTCVPAWFTEDGQLDAPKIEAFLTAMKAIRGNWTYEASVRKSGQDIKAQMQDMGIQMPEWNPYPSIPGRISMEENLGADMMMLGFQKQVPCLLRGADSLSEMNGQMKASALNASRFAALPGQAEGCFLPALMMGASKGGSNGEMALNFIAYALGEEIQNVNMREGFPVNAKALDAMQADNDEDGRHSNWAAGSPTIGMWYATWLDQAQRDQLRGIIDKLKTPVIPDFTLYQMIVSESTPFFEGKIDAGQAAANVCAKANAYLSE